MCLTIAELMGAIASMTAGGVLDRHPGLRCAFLEGTAGWLGRPPGRDRAAASCCPRTALRWLGPIRMAHRSTGSEPWSNHVLRFSALMRQLLKMLFSMSVNPSRGVPAGVAEQAPLRDLGSNTWMAY